jgi:arginyl-tRNA synthetase
MHIEKLVSGGTVTAIRNLWNVEFNENDIQVQKTRREFSGDITLVVFPFTKMSRKSPEETARMLGEELVRSLPEISGFNIIKGFLNLEISSSWWNSLLASAYADERYGMHPESESPGVIMVEYSSPNTNKPLHLGHIRNNLLGFSISRILEATGKKVIKANLVNDRGIHICKSMLAWKKWGKGETPATTGIKGDHLVGNYYVKFDQEYKAQIKTLTGNGLSEQDAATQAPLMREAQEMLRLWEAGDKEVVDLWKTMNGWVYAGFEQTYRDLGVSFDQMYYESNTYLLGKSIVLEGLGKGALYRKEDSSVWADMTADGLDHKLLLRSDGTSVYMTQDVGTAVMRFNEFPISELIYVVGNEQNYHFQALSLIMAKLGFPFAQHLHHLSYGMVELPEGRMKSREGTVVDADDLIEEMVSTARQMSQELGKLDGYSPEEASEVSRIVGLGALKYFILKVDPKKNMTFDPRESIDFNGNTGPFIQYTYARINSVLRKANDQGIRISPLGESVAEMLDKEKYLIQLCGEFVVVVAESAGTFSPSLIANYIYELSKEYNQFYHDYSILKGETPEVVNFRLVLSTVVGRIIKNGMYLLGMEVPERM